MWKVFVEGTGGLPEVVPGLMFETQEGAARWCKDKGLTPCYLMDVEEYREMRREQGKKVDSYRQQVMAAPMETLYIDDVYNRQDDGWKLHFNSGKDIDWMPLDKHGIAKVPMAKPKWFKGHKR